jgi:hypothetical protein
MTGIADYRLRYEYSPIVLIGGLCDALPGGVLPVTSLVDSINSPVQSPQPSETALDTGLPGVAFYPIPGSTAVDNHIGMYPFANQSVAANAIISQPLTISMLMVVPNRNLGDKRAAFENLQAQLAKH